MNTLGYAAKSPKTPLEPFQFQRRTLAPDDVLIEIRYCGICHTDLHIVRNEWKETIYPVVPGHEIVGHVTALGENVKEIKKGDLAAVGCLIDSCRTCPSCVSGLEQYCEKGFTMTYNSLDRLSGDVNYGGYSKHIVVNKGYVLQVPKAFTEEQLPGVAPLLCAGITTFSPLRFWGVEKGQKVGIVGLGGLGHMGVKLAHAMGAEVILFTTSPSKVEDGKRLGAHEVVISKNDAEMKRYVNSLDFILNTVAFPHNLDAYIELLRRDGTMCLVGAPAEPHPSPGVQGLIFKRRKIAGSLIGGIAETAEVLNFCADRKIISDVEVISMQDVNHAYERMLKNDVKYRFVIDLSSLN